MLKHYCDILCFMHINICVTRLSDVCDNHPSNWHNIVKGMFTWHCRAEAQQKIRFTWKCMNPAAARIPRLRIALCLGVFERNHILWVKACSIRATTAAADTCAVELFAEPRNPCAERLHKAPLLVRQRRHIHAHAQKRERIYEIILHAYIIYQICTHTRYEIRDTTPTDRPREALERCVYVAQPVIYSHRIKLALTHTYKALEKRAALKLRWRVTTVVDVGVVVWRRRRIRRW